MIDATLHVKQKMVQGVVRRILSCTQKEQIREKRERGEHIEQSKHRTSHTSVPIVLLGEKVDLPLSERVAILVVQTPEGSRVRILVGIVIQIQRLLHFVKPVVLQKREFPQRGSTDRLTDGDFLLLLSRLAYRT